MQIKSILGTARSRKKNGTDMILGRGENLHGCDTTPSVQHVTFRTIALAHLGQETSLEGLSAWKNRRHGYGGPRF